MMKSDGKSQWASQEEADLHQPFFLSIRQLKRSYLSETVWYTANPMGKNTLREILPKVAELAGIEGKITNHSVRKTSCSNNLHADVPPTRVQQFSGHQRPESLNSYYVANLEQQKEMSDNALYGPSKAKRMRQVSAAAGSSKDLMETTTQEMEISSVEHIGQGDIRPMASQTVSVTKNSTKVIDGTQGFLSSAIFNGPVHMVVNNCSCSCGHSKEHGDC